VATGLTVNAADVERAAYRQIAVALPAGYAADPSSLRVDVEPADGGLRVTARATGRPEIDPVALAGSLRGQRLPDAQRYLETGPPVESFTLEVEPGWWRGWFGRLPWRAGRIRVEILP
jgi:hypothetical protein